MVVDVHAMNSNARTRLHKLRLLMNKPVGIVEAATRGQVLLTFGLSIIGIFGWGIMQYLSFHDANMKMELRVEMLTNQVLSQSTSMAEMRGQQAKDHEINVEMAADVKLVKNWAYNGENGINDHRNRGQ